MKTILFNKLEITNFKGIEKLTVNFDNRTSLRGANGTGKTTVADALWWVLFNKDSNGSSDFPVKRKDKEGLDIHSIIVEVSLNLSVNNVTHILRRTQEENWVTKRGSNEPVMEGNIQALYYNESKLKSKEYQEQVGQLMDEETFKLLTNPMFFMTQIDYKKRREILLRLVGNDKDLESSLRSKSSYFLLDHDWSQDINFNKTFSQFYDYVRQKSKQNQDELDRLPYQIDELEKTISDLPDEQSIKALIKAYSKELSDLSSLMLSQPDPRIKELENQLRLYQQEQNSLIDKANKELSEKRSEVGIARQNSNFNIASIESKITLLKNQIDSSQISLDRKKQNRIDLLNDYKIKDREEWIEPVINATCPTCGQVLPNIDLTKLISDHRLNWEQEKKRKLDSIIDQGKEITQQITVTQQDINIDTTKINELKFKLDQEQMKLSALPIQDSFNLNQFVDSEQINTLTAQIQSLQNDLNKYYIPQTNNQLVDGNSQRKTELQALINDNNRRLGVLDVQKETQKRIKELKNRESTLVTEKNRFKTLVYLCELFERDKNETIEQQLSSHFGQIKWKLFRQQVNGGYQQVCDPMLNGRPYEAQSTGERIYTGCDIIKTFQGVYEIETPVLIDNRESLTLEIPLSSQIISMYADERYNVLNQQ